MPLAEARLALSATARVALPMRVFTRKYATARRTTTDTIMLPTSIQESWTPPNDSSFGAVAPGSCRVAPP